MAFAPQPRFQLYSSVSLYLEAWKGVLSQKLALGPALDEFEAEIAKQVGSRHCICTPMARSGIYLTIKNLISPGQKVILSPYTIVDVVNMVLCAGGVPVFADIESNTCNISPAEVRRLLEENSGDVGAVLITHLHGLACDLTELVELCNTHKVPLVEDTAQSFSCRVNEKAVGSFGTAGIFSFGMYKNLNCFFGGMVITDNDQLAEKIRGDLESFSVISRSFLGKKVFAGTVTDILTSPLVFSLFSYWIFRYAQLHNVTQITDRITVDINPTRTESFPSEYRGRMSTLQAELLLKQLKDTEKHYELRKEKATLYFQGLEDIKELTLPPRRDDRSHIYTYFPIQYTDRAPLVHHCFEQMRDFVVGHYRNCADLDIYSEFHRDCPNARQVSSSVIYMPIYPGYRTEQVQRNISVLREFFGKN